MLKVATAVDIEVAPPKGHAESRTRAMKTHRGEICAARTNANAADGEGYREILTGAEGQAHPFAFETGMWAKEALVLLQKAPTVRSSEDHRPCDRLDAYLDDAAAETARNRGASIVDTALGKKN